MRLGLSGEIASIHGCALCRQPTRQILCISCEVENEKIIPLTDVAMLETMTDRSRILAWEATADEVIAEQEAAHARTDAYLASLAAVLHEKGSDNA